MMLRLSRNCGVVTQRAVRGVLMYGSLRLLKSKAGLGHAGLASP